MLFPNRSEHSRFNQFEVGLWDFEQTEAELVAPVSLVLDEAEVVDERFDGSLLAWIKRDIAAPWDKVWCHFELVKLVVGNLTDGRESLQRFPVLV